MQLILAIPLPVRMAALFLLATAAGGLANRAVDRLEYCPRLICGPGLRIRPVATALLLGLGLTLLYWWETVRLGTLPRDVLSPNNALIAVLHVQYLAHAVFIWLMLVASLIDLDEKTIPDAITLPGTLLALALAAAYPWALLPTVQLDPAGQPVLGFLHLASPQPWPDALRGWPLVAPLAAALGCWWGWCFAILPRTWHARHGWGRAIALCAARMRREPATRTILRLGAVGTLAIAGVWFLDAARWAGLLSALVGMAASGGLVWAVRVIGASVLRREAMGFGDVTLMAMLGALLGWQPCLLLFFIAPFVALAAGLFVLVLRRETIIPYGPFLCLAALLILVRWPVIWAWGENVFAVGWLVPLVMVFCLGLMALLLGIWQALLAFWRGQ